MARYTTAESLSRRLDTFGRRLQDEQRKAVGAASLAMKNATVNELRRAVGGDLRMSGVGKRGAKVGVRYDVRGFTNPTSLVRAVGPVHLVERPTKPHRIPRQRTRGRRRFVVIPNVGVRAYADHPGTRGKRPWERGVKRGTPAATAAFEASIRASLRRQFG